MKKIVGIIATMALVLTVYSQSPKDKPNLDKLCGCFDVEFKYAETFSPDKDYKYHDREEISGGTEYIFPIVMTDKKIVMQHLLVISDSMIIKHWREDWSYEDRVIWKYKGDKTWVREQLSPETVKGKWTQSVWEVSDAPRYQGTAQWMNVDGKTVWQSTADAPLPRREYSVRSDYNILKRTNRLVITGEGWVHEQDNQKIVRKNGMDKLLVEEKGINSYRRIDDSRCASAKAYWEKNKGYWTKVRKAWEDYIAAHATIQLKTRVDGKVLHDHLFALEKEFANGTVSAAEIDGKIKASLEKYFGQEQKEVAHH